MGLQGNTLGPLRPRRTIEGLEGCGRVASEETSRIWHSFAPRRLILVLYDECILLACLERSIDLRRRWFACMPARKEWPQCPVVVGSFY